MRRLADAKFEQGAVPVVRKPDHDPIGVGLGLAVTTEWAGLHVNLPDLQVSPTPHARGAHAETLGFSWDAPAETAASTRVQRSTERTFDISADLHRQIA